MVDHILFALVLMTAHTIWMHQTDYQNGLRDPFGPYPRRGPHHKPKVNKRTKKLFYNV